MNIKHAPCLAVIIDGPNRDNVVSVDRFEPLASQIHGRPFWVVSSKTALFALREDDVPFGLSTAPGLCADSRLRPLTGVDDDPEATHQTPALEQMEALL